MADGSMKVCPLCRGRGGNECPDCGGDGEIECECLCGHIHFNECDKCLGEGDLGHCPDCDDTGVVPKTDQDLEHEGQINWLDEVTTREAT